ncbi:hypothetical protein ACQP3L_35160, partial [Escherichia coli]
PLGILLYPSLLYSLESELGWKPVNPLLVSLPPLAHVHTATYDFYVGVEELNSGILQDFTISPSSETGFCLLYYWTFDYLIYIGYFFF